MRNHQFLCNIIIEIDTLTLELSVNGNKFLLKNPRTSSTNHWKSGKAAYLKIHTWFFNRNFFSIVEISKELEGTL